jgi:hypothetical protein
VARTFFPCRKKTADKRAGNQIHERELKNFHPQIGGSGFRVQHYKTKIFTRKEMEET